MCRTLAEKRHNSVTKAIRKRKISEQVYHFSWYNNLHQYSKNKVHCSCPLCSGKTKKHRPAFGAEKGRRGGKHWYHSDVKRLVAMAEREREYELAIGNAS